MGPGRTRHLEDPVIDTVLPAGQEADEVTLGFAACLASVTEVPVDELPLAPTLAAALGAWRTWLAERGFGLVPIADPTRFRWAGWWIATVEFGGGSGTAREVAVLAFGTPPGVVLTPHAPELLGRPTDTLPIISAYAVASMDPVIRTTPSAAELAGTVEGLAVAPAAEAPMQLLESARARAGRGLDGDRYAVGAGTFSPRAEQRPGYDLTLIAAEVLDDLAAAGSVLDFAGSRRNVLTRGIDLSALIGRRFRIGDVECEGRRQCEPCAHLERLSGPGVLRPLIHRGGLRVDLCSDGGSGWARRSRRCERSLGRRERRPVRPFLLGERPGRVGRVVEGDHHRVGTDGDLVVLHQLLSDGERPGAEPRHGGPDDQPLPHAVVQLAQVVDLEPGEDQPASTVAHRQPGVLHQSECPGVVDVAEHVGVRPPQLHRVLVRRAHGRSAVSEDCRCPPWASSGSAWMVRSSDSARIASACSSGMSLPPADCSSGSSWARVSTFSSVTLATASGEGSFIDGTSEPLLLGAQAQCLGDVLDVLELPALGQPPQLGDDAV